MTAISRETHIVELVDEAGDPVGSATVDEAHQAPGRLHRAFSVFLRDPDGRVLLQQRAAVKTRFPLRWANTCCGHPEPGEPVTVAGSRRLVEEIGVGGAKLTEVGVYAYYAEDPASGRVEYEFDHVLVGDLPAGVELLPDPEEVADTRWVSIQELQQAIAAEPRLYAPWLAGVTERLAEYVASPDGAGPALSSGSVPEPFSGRAASGAAPEPSSRKPASGHGAAGLSSATTREPAPERSAGRPGAASGAGVSASGAGVSGAGVSASRAGVSVEASEDANDAPKRSSGGR
jgi:isopentenyl-diphosphate Delta-isomerase